MTSTEDERTGGPALMYVIKEVELVVRARLDDLLKPAGITATQYTALTVLRRSGPMSAAALARRSFVTPQSTADMIATLVRRELVSRRPDPTNGRQHQIALTASGQQLLADYDEPVQILEGDMTAALTEKQCADLRRYLKACRDGLAGKG